MPLPVFQAGIMLSTKVIFDTIIHKSSYLYTWFVAVIFLFAAIVGTEATAAPASRFAGGIVYDSITREPIPLANIYINNSKKARHAGKDGRFYIPLKASDHSIFVTSEGFIRKKIDLMPGDNTDMQIYISPSDNLLDEVIVTPKKQKYTKKNNPAVELMQRIRHAHNQGNPYTDDYYNFDQYEKITLALNDFKPDNGKGWLNKKFKFIYDYVDTSDVSGKPILPISVKEKGVRQIFRNKPKAEKEIITGSRRRGVEESLEDDNVQAFVEDLFREIDVYSNDIAIMQTRFVSPLSVIGADFYKYYITDTIPIQGVKHVELTFTPRNKQTFGFNGRMYVPMGDTTGFIRKIVMTVPRDINLNYVKNMYLVQDFIQDVNKKRHKVSDDMTVEFELLPGTQGIYGRRQTRNSNFSDKADSTYSSFYSKEGKTFMTENATLADNKYWEMISKDIPGIDGSRMESLAAKLVRQPVYFWTVKVIKLLVSGYIKTGKHSKFDIGTINNFVSYNSAEGLRLRFGGLTTANLNPHIFFRGYVAYGFHDHKWKYNAEIDYSLTRKKYHPFEFPVNGFKLRHSYDINHIGENSLSIGSDNFFLSLKRQPADLITYHRHTSLVYRLERMSGWSFEAGVKQERQDATRWLPFENGYGNLFNHYNTSAFTAMIRFAPGEKFVQSVNSRRRVNFDAPIIMIKHEYGPKGMLGASFTTNKTEISVSKRFWLSAFGCIDIICKGGKIWSRVQYPELMWPNANLSFTIQPETYPLLNAMEFAADSYASWDVTYWINGAILNRIPLIKKLKLREVVSFRGLLSHLSRKNNPEYCNELYRFPYDAHVGEMHGLPYMEAGVGLDNIFTFLRLDYVWRLTYRNAPNTDKSGLRINVHFTF